MWKSYSITNSYNSFDVTTIVSLKCVYCRGIFTKCVPNRSIYTDFWGNLFLSTKQENRLNEQSTQPYYSDIFLDYSCNLSCLLLKSINVHMTSRRNTRTVQFVFFDVRLYMHSQIQNSIYQLQRRPYFVVSYFRNPIGVGFIKRHETSSQSL